MSIHNKFLFEIAIIISIFFLSSTSYSCLAFTIFTSSSFQSSSLRSTDTDSISISASLPNNCPPISPVTNLPNKFYKWRGQQIRYQTNHEHSKNNISLNNDDSESSIVILIHGLFVNADHWRHTISGLSQAGHTVYAVDLLGYGYSDKPSPGDKKARDNICGERGRFNDGHDYTYGMLPDDDSRRGKPSRAVSDSASVLIDQVLGDANGGTRMSSELDLKHPCKSPYNFYTWSEQICDFVTEIVLPDNHRSSNEKQKVTIVCNSIGTISSLQSVLDRPDLFNGLLSVSPNFRELHEAEVALPQFTMPIVRTIQALLRSKGKGLFDTLANPKTVGQILLEPYAVKEAVDDKLVDVLLSPLLVPGAAEVVFDTLSYSAGPLPEQQLRDVNFPTTMGTQSVEGDDCGVPVWVCYGDKDPWTPAARVERLIDLDPVEKVVMFPGVGHCPHDEAPEMVNPLLLQFLERLNRN